jgi:hypothetical protein
MLQLLLASAVLAAPAPRVDDPPVPTGPAPQFAIVRLAGDGNLVQRELVPVTTQKIVVVKVNVQGTVVTRHQAVNVIEYKQVEKMTRVKGLQAFDTFGKPVLAEKLPELLKKDTLVLISADGKLPDAGYLRIVKEGTLILVLPSPTAPELPPVPKKD